MKIGPLLYVLYLSRDTWDNWGAEGTSMKPGPLEVYKAAKRISVVTLTLDS